MREYSKEAWDIASRYSNVLASETRDLAAAIDAAIEAVRLASVPASDVYRDALRDLVNACTRYEEDPGETLPTAIYIGAKQKAEKLLSAPLAEGQPSEVLQEIADSGTADAFDEADFAILYREIPEANTTTLQEITNVPHDFCREIARRLRFPSPAEKPTLSAGWRRQDEIARIIDKHVRSEPDKNFIDRRWLVGVSEAAAEIAALVGSSQPDTANKSEPRG